jgi:AIG2-like family.
MSATEWVFSYGTLRLPAVQQANYRRLLDGVADELPGFRLEYLAITNPEVIAVSGIAEHPVARHTGDPEDRVPGTRYSLSPEELVATDVYEAADYHRLLVELASGISAWLYVAKNPQPAP